MNGRCTGARRVDAVGELPQGFAPLGYGVVAAQPGRPDAVRRDVKAGLQIVELRVDRRVRQALRLCQGVVGRLNDVPHRGRLRQLVHERGGLLHPLVERHHGLEVVPGGVLQERRLQEREPPAPRRLLGYAEDRVGSRISRTSISNPARVTPLDHLRERQSGQDPRVRGQVRPEVRRVTGLLGYGMQPAASCRRPEKASSPTGGVGRLCPSWDPIRYRLTLGVARRRPFQSLAALAEPTC